MQQEPPSHLDSPGASSLSIDLERLATCARTQAALRKVARRVLGDPHAAEDAVQSAFLAAWMRPPRKLSIAWIRRVVVSRAIDHERSSPRHLSLEDEALAAPSHASANVADLIGAHRDLGEAVSALPKEQAEMVYLRYFENMPPAAIARSLNVPVETVKSRLARALVSLRKQLSATTERGSSPAGSASVSANRALTLVAFGSTPSAWTSGAAPAAIAPLLLGGLSMKKWIALACILALAAGLNFVPMPWVEQATPAVEPPVIALALVAPVPDLLEPPTLAESPPSRQLASPEPTVSSGPMVQPAADPSGSVRVRVTWSDGSPALGTRVGCFLDDELGRNLFLREAEVTASNGVLFEELVKGNYRFASSVRGESELTFDGQRPTTTKILIPDGVDISGVVRDATGLPVAQAEVWCVATGQGWQKHQRVGSADALGEFELRDIPFYAAIGAKAPGFSPSAWEPVSLLETTGSKADQDRAGYVELVLKQGGASLRGTVFDANGAPLAGALLVITTPSLGSMSDPQRVESVDRVLRSSNDGSYSVQGLQAGEGNVACAAKGFARSSEAIQLVDGAKLLVDVHLVAPGSVTGRVTDATGRPVPGATIASYSEPINEALVAALGITLDAPSGLPRAKSDIEGRYVLNGAPPGSLYLYCVEPSNYDDERRNAGLFTKCELAVASGQTSTWNPVIAKGRSLSGTLLFADRTPASAESIFISSESHEETRFASTDAAGRFDAHNLTGESYHLIAVLPTAEESMEQVSLAGVVPDGPSVELLAPTALPFEPPPTRGSARVHGSVIDPHGRFKGKARYLLEQQDGEEVDRLNLAGSEPFQFAAVSAGTYRVRVGAGDLWTLLVTEAFDVADGETLNLGSFTLPPAGGQRIHIVLDPDWPSPSGFVSVLSSDGETIMGGFLQSAGALLELDNLSPGEYSVAAHQGHVVPNRVSFEVEANQIGDTELVLEAGVNVEVHVQFRPSQYPTPKGSPPHPVLVRAFSEDGEQLRSITLDADHFAIGRASAGFCLPRGTVRFEASHPDAGRAEESVVLKQLGSQAPNVELDLGR